MSGSRLLVARLHTGATPCRQACRNHPARPTLAQPVSQQPQAFAQDLATLILAQETVRQPGFTALLPYERHFMLMPLMHSESQVIHEQAIPLFQRYTDRYALDFEVIIDRFGRYPHQNALLEHESTEGEVEFLKQEGSSF